MKVWFFNLDERLKDRPEVTALPAGEGAEDVFPHGKAGSNSDTCPSASLIHIAHLLDDADLLYKEAGTRAG